MKRVRTFVLAAALLAMTVPAHAAVSDFISATCGAGCADPVGEEGRARDNWSALTAMGTTQWIGSTIGSTTVDASGLLAAARVAGASELDRWLSTGQTTDNATAQQMSLAMQQFSGIDVSGITGVLPGVKTGQDTSQSPYGTSLASSSTSSGSNLDTVLTNALQTAASSGTLFSGPGGGGGSGYCDKGVESAVGANAQNFINNMQTIATSGEFGFSQLGNNAISSGQKSASGYYGSSCLDKMMSGTRDMLFKPPGLSSLLSQLGSMFGGGGGSGGGCGSAPSVMSQISKSMPGGIFSSGGGGFFPYLGSMANETGGGGSGSFGNGFGLSQAFGQTSMSQQPASLSALFNR